MTSSFDEAKKSNKAFSNWAKRNLFTHRVAGYKAVVVSLKAPGIAPGDATDEQMDHIAELADQYSYGEIVVTHDQNLVLPNVKQADLFSLWEKLSEKESSYGKYRLVNRYDLLSWSGFLCISKCWVQSQSPNKSTKDSMTLIICTILVT